MRQPLCHNTYSSFDFYPFGMIMPGRSYTATSSYRFGFNGKEKDNEMKGSDGLSYDFGARIYDPRDGRWFSLDPLQAKYPNLSPYVFTANNPVMYLDKDGKDYEVSVDHNTKTIIVKATYYYPIGDMKSKEMAIQGITALKRNINGGYQYQVKDNNGNITNYEIKYELEAKPSDDIDKSQFYGDDYKGKGIVGDLKDNKLTQTYGNSIRVGTDAEVQKLGESSGEVEQGYVTAGATESGHQITISDKRGSIETLMHEIGHSLGLNHMLFGLMETNAHADKSGLLRLNEMTIAGIQQTLANVGIGTAPTTKNGGEVDSGKEHAAKSSLKEKGKAPTNFNKGEVVKKSN